MDDFKFKTKLCFTESNLCPFIYSRVICKENVFFSWQKMAPLLQKTLEKPYNEWSYFYQLLSGEEGSGRVKLFLLKSWEYCLKHSWSVCLNANRSHLLHHRRNPCSTAFPCTFRGLSSGQYPTCQVRELNMSISLHLAKNTEGKAKVCFSISTFPFFFIVL